MCESFTSEFMFSNKLQNAPNIEKRRKKGCNSVYIMLSGKLVKLCACWDLIIFFWERFWWIRWCKDDGYHALYELIDGFFLLIYLLGASNRLSFSLPKAARCLMALLFPQNKMPCSYHRVPRPGGKEKIYFEQLSTPVALNIWVLTVH